MSLARGSRLATYEIVSPIGAGGMGEVYRARDAALNRDVAIKILPPAVAGDADRVARFQREAQVLAALNHPNVAQVYGFVTVSETDPSVAIVMELVEGRTLDDVIAARPVAIRDALAIAIQIADALDAAHELSIIHRDLKPSNLKIRDDNTVKVLDFGLAKVMEPTDGSTAAGAVSQLQTAGLATRPGIVVGTPAYMSPEQARGQSVDKRTDIWAFGCVLFELLTGRQAFPALTMADAIAGVLTREPDFTALPPSTPPAVRHVLARCLEKDPRQRMRDIADARAELANATLTVDSGVGRALTTSTRGRSVWKIGTAGAIGAALTLALVAAVTRWNAPATTVEHVIRLSLGSPGQFYTEPPSVVISPDGRTIAFVATGPSGNDLLWIRSLDLQDARPLPGTERADDPFWSPDSRSLGFFADGELKTITMDGRVQVLTKAPVSPGASWNQNGTILFAQGSGLKTIAAAGGTPTDVAEAGPRTAHRWPHFLPDGRHFLYFRPGGAKKSGVYVGSLDGGESTHLLDADFEAIYAPPGYLLFVRDETLLAQSFDTATLKLSGTPAAIASGVWVARGYGHGAFTVANNGTVAYANAAVADTQLAWFDRTGKQLGLIGAPGRYDSPPQISSNGSTVAIARGPFFQQDIWLLDSAHDTSTRFTFDPAGSRVPVWFHDGSRVLFQSSREDGLTRVYARNADGGGADERVSDTPGVNLQDVSPDGRLAVYMVPGKTGRFELWTMPIAGGAPTPFLQTDANNGQAQISPDGKWIAYVSNESGREEVFVESFPLKGGKRQVSDAGGAQPRWRKNGAELFYLAPDRTLMAVPVQVGATLQTGRPAALFQTRLEFLALQGPFFMPGFDVTADGQRFVLNELPTAGPPPIDVVLNWTALLQNVQR